MNTPRRQLICLCLVAGCLLALGHSSQALADPYDFSFRQGPGTMVIPVDDYRQFHSHLTNVGDNADSYTLTVTIEAPAEWWLNVCYDGICYAPNQTSFSVPETGTLAPGATIDFDFDVTSTTSEGPARYTIEFVSNSDGAVAGTWTFDVLTPSGGYDMIFTAPEGVEAGTVNDFIQFHPVLYNAGTMEDTYTLTMTRNHPAEWYSTFCYDGICYPPNVDAGQIPDGPGTIASGGQIVFDIDFTTADVEGTGSATVTIVSNTDPSLRSTATFTATTGSVVGVDGTPEALLSDLRAAPNPFNPKTDLRFNVGGTASQNAVIDIFDASGRRVRTLVAGDLAPGPQSVAWDGRGDTGDRVAAGVYLARVHVGDARLTIKMSLVK